MDITPRSPGIVACLTILSIEVLVAIFTYVCITYGILRVFHENKCLPPSKKIQCALNMSSFCFTMVSYANLLCDLLWPDLFTTLYINDILTSLTIYSVGSCAWLTALLCFFYFTKIVDVRCDFLVWAKKTMNSSAQYLTVVINMLCLTISFLSMVLFRTPKDPSTNSSVIPLAGFTYGARAANLVVAKVTLAMISLPFLTIIIATLLIVQFLKLHGHTMWSNMGNAGGDSLKMYRNIASQMIYFLFLYTAFYVVFFLYYFLPFSQQSPGYWVTMILMFSFTPAQFIMIIIFYPNANNNFKNFLHYFI